MHTYPHLLCIFCILYFPVCRFLFNSIHAYISYYPSHRLLLHIHTKWVKYVHFVLILNTAVYCLFILPPFLYFHNCSKRVPEGQPGASICQVEYTHLYSECTLLFSLAQTHFVILYGLL